MEQLLVLWHFVKSPFRICFALFRTVKSIGTDVFEEKWKNDILILKGIR